MEKQQIRRFIQKITRSITPNERSMTSDKILEAITATTQFNESHCVALFLDLPDEVAASGWIEPIIKAGHRVVIPRVEGEQIEFFDYNKERLKVGHYGILEPTDTTPISAAEIDLMILPGVAFCADGRRLGRGKGYYDRYLARKEFRAYTIGVGYSHQLVDEIPCEPHDRKLDHIITPFVASSIPQIMRQIIESADGDSKRLGCGVDRLIPMGYTWVLLRFSMSLCRTPEADEPLTIETWINDCSRITTTRNFIIRDQSDDIIGEAVSQWCIIDIHKRTPVELKSSSVDYEQHVSKRDNAFKFARKIGSIDQDAADYELYTHTASTHDLDFNQHVNTFRYIEMMLSMLPHDELSRRGGCYVDTQFVKECYLGEELTIMHQRINAEGVANCSSTTPLSHFEIVHPDQKSAVKALFQIR